MNHGRKLYRVVQLDDEIDNWFRRQAGHSSASDVFNSGSELRQRSGHTFPQALKLHRPV
jgi:hypothetical protein